MAKESKNILLVVGDDDYAAETEAKHAIEAHVPEDYRASAVEVVAGAAQSAEGQLASIRSCLASVQTPPFLDPVKLTWWKEVSFFPGGGRGGRISDEVKEALERFADTLTANPLPENQFLVITATTLLSTSIFAKRMKPIAEMKDCSVPERSKDRAAAAAASLRALKPPSPPPAFATIRLRNQRSTTVEIMIGHPVSPWKHRSVSITRAAFREASASVSAQISVSSPPAEVMAATSSGFTSWTSSPR